MGEEWERLVTPLAATLGAAVAAFRDGPSAQQVFGKEVVEHYAEAGGGSGSASSRPTPSPRGSAAATSTSSERRLARILARVQSTAASGCYLRRH